jgi:hypothetical protein
MKKILYVGPSWAARSYDTPEGSESDFTNLVKELNLDVDNQAKIGTSNLYILKTLPSNYQDLYRGIIWVYAEPLTDLTSLGHYTQNLNHITPDALIKSENFWEMREEINQFILSKLSNIKCPIGFIGAHGDVPESNYSNFVTIHPSWQKFLANHVGVQLDDGWGAEVSHRSIMTEYAHVTPSKAIINKISDTFASWHKLELNRVFNWCHPNKKGNNLFAKEIANNVQSFINNL